MAIGNEGNQKERRLGNIFYQEAVMIFYITAFLCFAQIVELIPSTFANKINPSSLSEDHDGSYQNGENSGHRMLQRSCEVSTTVPISSRGFARSCCDVYPAQFGGFSGGYFEAGVDSDPLYFVKKEIKSGDVVFVVSPDFPKLLDRRRSRIEQILSTR